MYFFSSVSYSLRLLYRLIVRILISSRAGTRGAAVTVNLLSKYTTTYFGSTLSSNFLRGFIAHRIPATT
jgi:hypothetical protein